MFDIWDRLKHLLSLLMPFKIDETCKERGTQDCAGCGQTEKIRLAQVDRYLGRGGMELGVIKQLNALGERPFEVSARK